MGHKSLVNSTAYEITGGNTLIGGTNYNISSGKTLVGGTGYGIPFGWDGLIFDGGDDVLVGEFSSYVTLTNTTINNPEARISINNGVISGVSYAAPTMVNGAYVVAKHSVSGYIQPVDFTGYTTLHCLMSGFTGSLIGCWSENDSSITTYITSSLDTYQNDYIELTIDISAFGKEGKIKLTPAVTANTGPNTLICSKIWLT